MEETSSIEEMSSPATEKLLQCDYLVIGAGACAMAFVDELLASRDPYDVIIVDRHSAPGGHWNDAYDFVKLHQPSEFYGVNSKPLERRFNSLATHAEIRAYYEEVMRWFVDSGRVTFLPQCEYKGDACVRSLLDPDLTYRVRVRRKTVDATYIAPHVPSTTAPVFKVADGVHVTPVNGLSRMTSPWKRYVIIGGGKTGIDAVLFLLNNAVPVEKIRWIVPNDYWLLNRKFVFTDAIANSYTNIMECIKVADDARDLFARWERLGWVLRIDGNVEPRSLKGATATVEEVEQLRTVKENIVRHGRIRSISTGSILFENGTEIETDSETLHVDCSANGSAEFVPKPIFEGLLITLQDVRLLQSVYSAAVIGKMEQMYPDDEELKNSLKGIRHPQTVDDYVVEFRNGLVNEMGVAQHLGVWWLRNSRLNWEYHVPLLPYIRWMVYVTRNGPKVFDKLNALVEMIEKVK